MAAKINLILDEAAVDGSLQEFLTQRLVHLLRNEEKVIEMVQDAIDRAIAKKVTSTLNILYGTAWKDQELQLRKDVAHDILKATGITEDVLKATAVYEIRNQVKDILLQSMKQSDLQVLDESDLNAEPPVNEEGRV